MLPDVELYMIQAAPNQCQNRSLRMVTPVDWHFAPTYHAVSGTISDSATNQPISSATVTITGTTESGVTSEEVTADADGFYTSQGQYLAGTDLTVSAVAPSYTSNSVSGTVVQEGENTFNVALDPIPVTGTISGTITDSDTNEPIANAMVTITGTGVDGSEVSETTTSDSNGQYVGEIEFLAGTAVTVSATAEDYTGDAATIEAIEEGVNTANVALSPITLDESPTPDPEGTVTPTPSPEETVTPGPDPEGTVTPTPRPEGTETPTPVPTEDVPPAEEPTAPVTEPVTPTAPANEAESTPTAEATTPTEDPKNDSTPKAVTGLPSTGVGGAAPANLLLIGTIASAGIIGVAIRRTKD